MVIGSWLWARNGPAEAARAMLTRKTMITTATAIWRLITADSPWCIGR